jgi:hypothetical protein
VSLRGYPNGGTDADLANGAARKMFFFGANYDQELGGGWSIVDKFLSTAATSTRTRCSPAATRRARRRAVQHLHRPRRFRSCRRVGHGDVRRRRRGAADQERHPPGLVVHPQEAARTSTTISGSARRSSTATR